MQAALAIDGGSRDATSPASSPTHRSKPPAAPATAARRARRIGGSSGAYAFAGDSDAAYGTFGVNAPLRPGRAAPHASLTGRPTTTSARSRSPSAPGRRATRRRSSRGTPLTLEDYHASRWVVEPFHLLDCCLVSNGGLAVIVTSAERARDLRQPPVYLWGMGQGHPGGDPLETLTLGRARSRRRRAFAHGRHRRSPTSTSASSTTATRSPCW